MKQSTKQGRKKDMRHECGLVFVFNGFLWTSTKGMPIGKQKVYLNIVTVIAQHGGRGSRRGKDDVGCFPEPLIRYYVFTLCPGKIKRGYFNLSTYIADTYYTSVFIWNGYSKQIKLKTWSVIKWQKKYIEREATQQVKFDSKKNFRIK